MIDLLEMGRDMGQYQEALDYIFGYVNYERQARYPYDATTFNLRRMEELLERLGRPQSEFQCVHIAGTKGKGSTSAMVESVLRTAGFRTGLYTSPHLHTFRERIRVNGALMSKQEVVDLLAQSRQAIEATPGITAFEVMTALAFLHFARQGVEWAVLEVGLGGRLDATNVVHPAVCAITSLSYDHVELLGYTLSLIAWEKAGIIKAGVPVVCAPQEPEAMEVIQRVCADTGARLVSVGDAWTWEGDGAELTGQTLTVHRTSDNLVLNDLCIPLLGHHQLVNATSAVAILAELNAQGVVISTEDLRAGLATARWPGRFEVLQLRPVLVIDSAHNADSARRLRAALGDWFPRPPAQRLALIFGASADKDIAGMLSIFLSRDHADTFGCVDKVIVTQSGHPRAAAPAHLADQVRGYSSSCPISVQDTVEHALAEALAWAGPDDVICVTGSIFVVAQARLAWARRHPEAFPTDDWVFSDESPGTVVSDDEPVLFPGPHVHAGARS
jgi:dihydrofolate synthase / folylpolyglutamate synthase